MDSDIVDIVDRSDRVIFQATRKEMRIKVLIHRTSHFFLFNSKGEIFLTKRSKNKDYAPLKWEIGQGGVLDTNELYDECAKRELSEELGIDSNPIFLFKTYFEDDKTKLFASVYEANSDSIPNLQKEEIEEGKFISVSNLENWIKLSPNDFTSDSLAIYRILNSYKNSIPFTSSDD